MQLDAQNPSHLFTLRLWVDFVDCETDILRIRVQHVLSGEVRYFQEWEQAVVFIEEHSVEERSSEQEE